MVIVCYNGVADTLECLASVARLTYPNVQTVVVDNASTDGTAGAVREAFSRVHVIETGDNTGFAGGNNVGVRFALDTLGAAYTFLLNNDTTVEPGLLEPLVAHTEAHPAAGIVAPLMCYHAVPDTVWSAGGAMNHRAEAAHVSAGRPVAAFESHAPRSHDFVAGCGMLIRRDVWERVGLFDERFFLYYEDADLCFRARRAGYACVVVPGVRLWHKVSRSTGATSDLTLYYMRRNALLFLRKHSAAAGRLAALADDARLFALWTLRGNNRRATVLRRAVADYFAKRFGRGGSQTPIKK